MRPERFALAVMFVGLACAVLRGQAPPASTQPPTPAQDSTSVQASQGVQAGTDKYKFDRHTVAVTFNYDFNRNPSCEEKPKFKKCIAQFVVYDVSRQRIKLFSIPVPEGARGLVTGIKGKGQTRILLPGTHMIAVTAQGQDGTESSPGAAIVAVAVQSSSADSNSVINQEKPQEPL